MMVIPLRLMIKSYLSLSSMGKACKKREFWCLGQAPLIELIESLCGIELKQFKRLQSLGLTIKY